MIKTFKLETDFLPGGEATVKALSEAFSHLDNGNWDEAERMFITAVNELQGEEVT